jgi:hypothetical protein
MKLHFWDIMAVLGIFTLSCWFIVMAFFLKMTLSDLKKRGGSRREVTANDTGLLSR